MKPWVRGPRGAAGRRISLMLLTGILGLAGCRAVRVPYPYDAVNTRARPVHAVRVAVLPLVDARPPAERTGGERFIYRGLEYIATRMEAIAAPPMFEVTEVVARHLARTGVFAQVVLVRDAGQGRSQDADLLLRGAVYRLRGYVEARPPAEERGRSSDERRVLAEVVLKDLTFEDLRGRILMAADAGWALSDVRHAGPGGTEPDPWRVLAEAMQVALTTWTREVARADLSGRFVVRERVRLGTSTSTSTSTSRRPFGRLSALSPEGWRFVQTSTAARPIGWRGPERCQAAHFGLAQTVRFHRVLGPYQPRVNLWACTETHSFAYDGRADFPARLLGHAADHWYFSLALGESNWPDAEAQIAAELRLERPPKYRFHVGAGDPAHACASGFTIAGAAWLSEVPWMTCERVGTSSMTGTR